MAKLTNPAGAKPVSAPVAISNQHDTRNFDSGKPPLDDWLKQRALKAEGQTARTYVVCIGDDVVGYYTLANGSVRRDQAPKKLQRNAPEQLPVIILARLAVDQRCHGQGIGCGMLQEALNRALTVSLNIGVQAVLVHAIDDAARAVYQKYDFIEFPSGTNTLFLPISAIGQVLP
jgi:GNAT superfamily N-acetyltransferase